MGNILLPEKSLLFPITAGDSLVNVTRGERGVRLNGYGARETIWGRCRGAR